jgi:AraC family transcriptional regulator
LIEHFSITDDDLNRRPGEGKTSIIYSELQNFEEQLSDHSLSLKYTVKGQEIYRTGGNSYTLGAGNILITPPKQKIEGSVKGAEIATGICLHFDKELVDETFHSMGRNIDENNPGNDFSPEEFTHLHLHHSEHHFHRQLRLINTGELDLEFKNEIAVYLCAEICKKQLETRDQYRNLGLVKKSTQQEVMRRLLKARHFIYDYHHTNIDLSTIAEIVCLSKFHLLRYFKNAYQITPHQFVIQCRLEKAIGLLKNQSLSISEVAIKSGFADAAAFGKAFKQRYGVSPGLSRKWDA